MDDQRRKRKMDEAEESEEEKMEKFFALIRSTREMRQHMITGGLVRPKADADKKPIEEKHKVTAGWHPTFQPEDFMVDARLKVIDHGCMAGAGSSQKGGDGHKEEGKRREGDGLDLNLSL